MNLAQQRETLVPEQSLGNRNTDQRKVRIDHAHPEQDAFGQTQAERKTPVPSPAACAPSASDRKRSAGIVKTDNPEHGVERMACQLAALDSMHMPDLRFIKCDVEGHEVNVFSGTEQTITKSRPVIQFEAVPAEASDLFWLLRKSALFRGDVSR